jgi:hypothetical protein
MSRKINGHKWEAKIEIKGITSVIEDIYGDVFHIFVINKHAVLCPDKCNIKYYVAPKALQKWIDRMMAL